MTRAFYRVVKTTVLTEDQTHNSKSYRKLDLGEMVEVHNSPVDEGGLKRARCTAASDSKEGWITMVGNQGSVFLEPASAYYTCVKETTLADGMAVGGSKTVRKVAKGEHVHMIEPEQKD